MTNGEDAPDLLAVRFDAARPMLRSVAYRMLGSASEADDAVQEAWLRLSRADAYGSTRGIKNLEGWLTTVVARVCLDALRVRATRREAPLDVQLDEPSGAAAPVPVADLVGGADLEHEAQIADAVGLALLVVLDRLSPAERVAFVLHDAFGVSFEEIAVVVGRTPTAARQLASRARRRVRGTPLRQAAALRSEALMGARAAQRAVVDAYLAASRAGDVAALLAVLDPDIVLRVDPTDVAVGVPGEVRGARAVAGRALAYAERAPFARAALVDGAIGIVVAPRGQLLGALRLEITDGTIAAIEVVTNRTRLARLDLAVLDA